MDLKQTHKRIGISAAVGILIVVVVVVGFLARRSSKNFEKVIVAQTQQHLLTIAQTQASNIEHAIKDVESKLEILATNLVVHEKFKENIRKSKALKDKYSPFEDVCKHLGYIVGSVYRLDSNGIVQRRVPFKERRKGLDFSKFPGVKYVLGNHKPHVSEGFITTSGRRAISVCVPVFEDAEFIGILRALVYLETINNRTRFVKVGQKGYAQIIDDSGIMIAHPKPEHIGKDIIATRKEAFPDYDWAELEEIVARMTRGQEGVGSYHSAWWHEEKLQLIRKLTAFAPIRLGNKLWSIGITMGYNEVSGPVIAQTRNISMAAGLLILVFAGAVLWFYKTQKEKTKLVAEAESAEKLRSLNEQLEKETSGLRQAKEELSKEIRNRYRVEEQVQKNVSELEQAQQATLNMMEDADQANKALSGEIATRSSAQKTLRQHIKQLNCLYGLSRLIVKQKITLEQIFQETPDLIRSAYQCPDATCVRITFEGIQYKTDNFEKSQFGQYAPINMGGNKAGEIEVFYLREKPETGRGPFLEGERVLLDAVAENLGRTAERKRATETLRLFRNLIDRSNDSIFVMEPEWGRFLDVNDRACDSLGYTREELLNKSLKDVEESILDDSTWQEHVKKLKRKADLVIEGEHRRKDGTTFYVETSLRLVTREDKDYVVAVARDFTERKQAEQKQAQLLEQLEAINDELKDFAYIVSHDLKAPLRGIKMLADWLIADYADKLDDNGREQMNLLMSRVRRMHNLIDGVLQYSKIGRVKEEKGKVNLNDLVSEVIDTLTPPENLGITVEITVENELPVIECEETRITQVFQNLLSNAIKYMDKPRGHIRIGCVEENGFWNFSVADNGPGIEEKHFERIFRIFQTLSSRDEFESTGVGLTVVKKIVELYGGKIWVESKLGEGSTFFFTLPNEEMGVKNAKLEANIVS